MYSWHGILNYHLPFACKCSFKLPEWQKIAGNRKQKHRAKLSVAWQRPLPDSAGCNLPCHVYVKAPWTGLSPEDLQVDNPSHP